MRILLMRHGIAEDLGPAGDDDSRRLTSEGRSRTTEVVRGLCRLIDPPKVILSSPRVRARQTAKIAARAMDLKVQICPALAAESPGPIVEIIGQRPESEVMLVGHEPTLSQTVELLCGLPRPGGFVQLKKASCAALEADRRADGSLDVATLLWLATPRMLRSIS